jgi:hypothetical protein
MARDDPPSALTRSFRRCSGQARSVSHRPRSRIGKKTPIYKKSLTTVPFWFTKWPMPGAAPFEPPIAIQQPAGPQAAQAHILAALALLMRIALLTALAMLRTAGRFRLSINRRRKAPRAAPAPRLQPLARPAPTQRRRIEPPEILLPETQARISALLATLRIEGAAAQAALLAATAPAPQSATPPAASRRRRLTFVSRRPRATTGQTPARQATPFAPPSRPATQAATRTDPPPRKSARTTLTDSRLNCSAYATKAATRRSYLS